jgi:hypothetical protein
LVAAKLAQSTLFDRSILMLAAGAFAVSLTFVRQIVPPGRPQARWVLGLAWVLIGASLLSTLFSLLSSQSACQRAIGLLEDGGTTNRPAMLTKFLNWLSIAAFAAGVGLLAVFAYVNLN